MSDQNETLSRLEEEGEIAADYLEELLDIADLDGDIEIDVENGRASVAIVSDEPDERLQRLVGKDGEVLDALQTLTRLAVQQKTGERSRLMLDIAGYRDEVREELRARTLEAIERVKAGEEGVELEPMNPFERKICHDVVAEVGMFSESEGVAPNRFVVIYSSAAEAGLEEEDEAETGGEAIGGTVADEDAAAIPDTDAGIADAAADFTDFTSSAADGDIAEIPAAIED